MELDGDFQPNVFDEDSSWSAVMNGIEPIDYANLQAANPSRVRLIQLLNLVGEILKPMNLEC